MAIPRRALLGGGLAVAGLLMAGPAAFGQEVNLGQANSVRTGGARLFSVGDKRILVIRRSAKKFVGYLASCPHDQTQLTTSNVRGSRITCPNDKSVFNVANGNRVSGPTTKGLERVQLRVTNGFLIATLGTTASPTPTTGELIESSKVPVGGGVKVESAAGVLMIVQPTRGNFAAFSAVCTHAGCEVSRVTSRAIICTCHDSEFSTSDGSRLAGPATRALKQFEVVERSGMLFLK